MIGEKIDELDEEMIKKLSKLEIADSCILVNELERTFKKILSNDIQKEVFENIIKEYSKISTIAMSKALVSARKESQTWKDYKELKESKLELESIVLTEILNKAEPTTLN